MRHSITIILYVLFLPNFVFSQDFGCYDINSINNNVLDGIYTREHVSGRSFYKIDWNKFTLDSDVKDGYYKKYYFSEGYCSQFIKMEGLVKNGVQEGLWKLYLSKESFYYGFFINGEKQGLWTGLYINEQGDSICFAEIKFKNNLYDGIAKYYFSNNKLDRTISYQNGLINGQEIEYFKNDTTEVKYIRELKEYSNGKLNGEYLVYRYNAPFDTLTYGKYSHGKKNGRFIYYHYGGEKTIVDYINDEVEGKFIKYYGNGVLACEFDYRNNLPYNLIQINDTSGNTIESNILTEGTGELKYYYDNGTLFSSCEYNDQLISGKFYRYYKSGTVMEEGFLNTNIAKSFKKTRPIEQCEDLNLFSAWQLNFADGTDYTVFNKDGSIRAKLKSSFNDSIAESIIICENYENGKLLSKETLWRGLEFGQVNNFYDNGTLEMTGNYIIIDNDSIKVSAKNGVFKYFHSNGLLKAEINYSSGEEIGNSYFYDDSGVLKRTKVIKSNGEIYNIYDNDTVNRIDEKGRKQGKWISLPHSYSENNCYYIPNQIKYFKNNNPIGTWEYFSYDGERLTERIVWQDSINSYCQRWGYNDKLIEEGSMTNEIKNGEWKEYDYKKGYLKFKGQFNCGEKDGIWQEYKRNGKMIKKIEYIEGQVKNAL